MLGSKLVASLPEGCRMFTTYNKHVDPGNSCSFHLDVTDKGGVQQLIRKISPDVIIHTAALTDVDYCETNREEAWNVNVEGTRNIAEASRESNSKLVYVSTDYVFDGERGMYKEDDQPNPVGQYGKTKLEGENVVLV